jgi:ankyrin repeat protein
MRPGRLVRPLVVVMLASIAVSAAPGDLRLVEAVKAGNDAAVRALLRQGAPVDADEADGTTALHWAVRADDEAVTRLLVRAGASVGAANRYGVTPLSLAAVNGSARLVGLLLEAGADPNAATPEGETILMTAARTGDPASVARLISAGAHVNVVEQWRGETALMWAAGENNAAAVRALIEGGASLDTQSRQLDYPDIRLNLAFMATTELPRGGMSAVMLAARQGGLDAVRVLADAGANLDLQDPEGTTALMLAIINAHYEVAVLLAEQGANLNVYDRAGMGALYAAVDMHTATPLTNLPPRAGSGTLDSLAAVSRLLARGADPNAALTAPTLRRHHSQGDGGYGEGTTPLMRAARFADTAALRILLEHGADPQRRQRNQTTALLIAAGVGGRPADGAPARQDRGTEADAVEAIAVCLSHGADVNAANANGETALHVAAGRGTDSVVRLLAERGANLEARDKFNRTPLDVALGAPAGAGRGGTPAARGTVQDSTAALLRDLMQQPDRATH